MNSIPSIIQASHRTLYCLMSIDKCEKIPKQGHKFNFLFIDWTTVVRVLQRILDLFSQNWSHTQHSTVAIRDLP